MFFQERATWDTQNTACYLVMTDSYSTWACSMVCASQKEGHREKPSPEHHPFWMGHLSVTAKITRITLLDCRNPFRFSAAPLISLTDSSSKKSSAVRLEKAMCIRAWEATPGFWRYVVPAELHCQCWIPLTQGIPVVVQKSVVFINYTQFSKPGSITDIVSKYSSAFKLQGEKKPSIVV